MSRIGYQGEPGAYSDDAVLELFPGSESIGHPTFARLFDALLGGEIEAGVLPVENSLSGIVQEVNDLLWERSGVRITAEQLRPVRYCLLGRGEPILRALSDPQALAQCSRYLERRGIQPVSFPDTAGAARAVSEGMIAGSGAIASAAAGKRYGLNLLAEGLENDSSNQTRFVVVERGEPARPGDPGLNKASLAFIGAHRPGSLASALQCFAQGGVNLSRLDSRPLRDRPWQYRFYLDIEIGDPEAANAALAALEEEAMEVKLFGTYPAASSSPI